MPDPGNLYIRWSNTGADDNRSDPGSSTWWLSKSLQIINPADASQDEGLALTETDQQIRVLVDTTLQTTNVGVQVWACAWGTAGQPFLPSANGEQGLERDLDDSLNPYTANPAPPAAQLAVDLDWRPLNTDLSAIGAPSGTDLKVCLLANCYSTAGAGDGAKLTAPGRPAIDVPGNRHHAQRNVMVHPIMNFSGRPKIKLFAGNPFDDGEEPFVLKATQPPTRVFGKGDLKRLQAGRWLAQDAALPGKGARVQLPQEPIREIGLSIAGERSRGGAVKVPLRAREPQLLELDLGGSDAAPGTVHVIDITQHRRDSVVGGARALVVTVDEGRFAAFGAEQTTAA